MTVCVISGAFALIWQSYCGQYIGRNIQDVVEDLRSDGAMVIHPRNQSEIDLKCEQLDQVVVLPKGLISKVTFHVSDQCVVERAEMGFRK